MPHGWQRQTRAEWQLVFYVAAAIYLFGAVFYVIFASGVLEPWACKQEMSADVEVKNQLVDSEAAGKGEGKERDGEAEEVCQLMREVTAWG